MQYIEAFSDQGPLLHFAHGNAFPPKAYQTLLKELGKNYKVIAHKFRSLNNTQVPKHFWEWEEILEDWDKLFQACGYQNMISVGHSMGGILSLKLAALRPEYFSHLILMDPLFLTSFQCLAWRLLKKLRLSEHFYLPASQAKRRKTHFQSKEDMWEHYREKGVFKAFSDEDLKLYVEAVAEEKEEGVFLNFSPSWEARIYKTYPHITWKALLKVKVPILILSGENSSTFFNLSKSFVQKHCPHIHYQSIKDTGHLLPMEKPLQVAEAIKGFLEQHAVR